MARPEAVVALSGVGGAGGRGGGFSPTNGNVGAAFEHLLADAQPDIGLSYAWIV